MQTVDELLHFPPRKGLGAESIHGGRGKRVKFSTLHLISVASNVNDLRLEIVGEMGED